MSIMFGMAPPTPMEQLVNDTYAIWAMEKCGCATCQQKIHQHMDDVVVSRKVRQLIWEHPGTIFRAIMEDWPMPKILETLEN